MDWIIKTCIERLGSIRGPEHQYNKTHNFKLINKELPYGSSVEITKFNRKNYLTLMREYHCTECGCKLFLSIDKFRGSKKIKTTKNKFVLNFYDYAEGEDCGDYPYLTCDEVKIKRTIQ